MVLQVNVTRVKEEQEYEHEIVNAEIKALRPYQYEIIIFKEI